ncbi:MAG TPA: universal stress protein [Nitrososphaerales archaeon]|nr:universal stress protein [Nitrososphaerales archaeon]HUK75673.1 universal stress protein [Nitrososphaerales archaeon]
MSQKGVFQRIIVGYDGSDNARRALSTSIGLAKQSKGELRIAVVADTMRYAGAAGMYQRYNEETKQNAENLAEVALEQAKKAGVDTAYASAEEGQPADMILTLATEYKSELIVVGRRGMRGIQRFLMGSVSTAVINHAKCDVLIVK